MAEEFQIQSGICGENWWNSSRSVFTAAATAGSPCSLGSGTFVWPNHNNLDFLDMKAATRSSSSSGGEETDNTSCNIFQEVVVDHDQDQKPHHHLIDSTLQIMGFGLSSSPTSDFSNQTFVSRSNTGRSESNNNIYSMLQEDMAGTKLNYRQEIGLDSSQIEKDWTSTTTTTTTSPPKDFCGDVVNGFKPNIQQDLSAGLDQPISSANCAVTSQALSAGFPVTSAPFGYTSATLLQNLFDGETTNTQPHQQSFCNNQSVNSNYSSLGANYGSNMWPRFSPLVLNSRPSPPPSIKYQQPTGLHFSNNTPFWNASSPGPNDGVFPSTPPPPQQLRYVTPKFEELKPKCNNYHHTTTAKANNSNEDVHDLGSVPKKSTTGSEQPVLKRPRIETPSPLPTFKVRKEKLGDRITALQQLVSPFGKTDTASVLHEAIEYIKFLHDQVSVLSTPYMKNGAAVQVHQQASNKLKDQDECPKQDLKSRGLCLVPISITFPVANETTADFWTPTSTFGATFR